VAKEEPLARTGTDDRENTVRQPFPQPPPKRSNPRVVAAPAEPRRRRRGPGRAIALGALLLIIGAIAWFANAVLQPFAGDGGEPVTVTIPQGSSLSQIADILRDRPSGFAVLSGDDALTLPVMALGGDGVISVVSNATPRLMAALTDACAAGDFGAARTLHRGLQPWMAAAFVESNPIPVKAALAMMGRIENALRLPLVPLADSNHHAVRASLVAAGALES